MLNETETEQINDQSAELPYCLLHHQAPPSVPPFPEGTRTEVFVVNSDKPTLPSPSPQNQPRQSSSTSTSHRPVRKMLVQQQDVSEDHLNTNAVHEESPQTVREVLQLRKIPDPQTHHTTAGMFPHSQPTHVFVSTLHVCDCSLNGN